MIYRRCFLVGNSNLTKLKKRGDNSQLNLHGRQLEIVPSLMIVKMNLDFVECEFQILQMPISLLVWALVLLCGLLRMLRSARLYIHKL